ncbi:contactin [Plakobranchus ocellatus]|uniref:Contactin n=1 Tax=Plakobranchus ocellatus TaxID=259542 RepID=A0AAV4AZT6_9GAST|nr:contactin [Plakobranchus ocellatus]
MLPKHPKLSDHNRVLVIREARLEDQGVYTCHVQRESIAEHKAVDLKLEAKPYFIKPIHNQHADIGAALTWRCDARASPAPNFLWMKNGQDESFGEVNSTSSETTLKTLTRLFEPGPKTNNNFGFFRASTEGTHITVAPEDQRAPVNNTVFLQCSAAHAPGSDMIYQWKFNGITIDFHRHPEYQIVSGHNYILRSLLRKDIPVRCARTLKSVGLLRCQTGCY